MFGRPKDDVAKQARMEREAKDEFLKHHPESPIPPALRGAFRGLAYYDYDLKFRFDVKLDRYPTPEPVTLATSKGVPRPMLKWGSFTFTIDGQTRTLQAYISAHAHGEASLFVPFRDATSGRETYGAARYLDLPVTRNDRYVLDFNAAYNPYCAYSDDYVCPFPPRENWLDIPVRAGEKDFPRKE